MTDKNNYSLASFEKLLNSALTQVSSSNLGNRIGVMGKGGNCFTLRESYYEDELFEISYSFAKHIHVLSGTDPLVRSNSTLTDQHIDYARQLSEIKLSLSEHTATRAETPDMRWFKHQQIFDWLGKGVAPGFIKMGQILGMFSISNIKPPNYFLTMKFHEWMDVVLDDKNHEWRLESLKKDKEAIDLGFGDDVEMGI